MTLEKCGWNLQFNLVAFVLCFLTLVWKKIKADRFFYMQWLPDYLITSESKKKPGQIHYFDLSRFFWLRRYLWRKDWEREKRTKNVCLLYTVHPQTKLVILTNFLGQMGWVGPNYRLDGWNGLKLVWQLPLDA